jgi:hypothetical protein
MTQDPIPKQHHSGNIKFHILTSLVIALSWTSAFVQITRELFEAVGEPLRRQLLTHLVIAATDSELPEVASAAGRAVKKVILDSKLVAEKLEKMSSAQLKQQPIVSPGGMVLRTRRYSMKAAVEMLQIKLKSLMHKNLTFMSVFVSCLLLQGS